MDNKLESWARSLVGRDWEIYWSDDGSCKNKETREMMGDEKTDTAETQNESMVVECAANTNSESNDRESDDDECQDEVDEEDWYDGHIEEMDCVTDDGKYSFRVSFVGDDTIYTMMLEPKIVRPSVKAWIKRSKALLSTQSQPSSNCIVEWENSLPADTRTIDDEEQLTLIASKHVEYEWPVQQQLLGSSSSPSVVDGRGVPTCRASEAIQGPSHDAPSVMGRPDMPSTTELDQIKRLSTLLRAQMYLRSKLPPVVAEEAYVDHLLQCLRRLEEASQWYVSGWRLHRKIFLGSWPSLGNGDILSAKLDEDYAIKQGLQEGRRVITNLLRVDTSLAGSKRRRPAENSPCGTRKTKRRRRNKSLLDFIKESERGGKTPKPDEDEFLSADAVLNFVDQVQCNDTRWYTRQFSKMMKSISNTIVAPLLMWKHRVETILGDRPESENEGDKTDGETSDEDSDEDGKEASETSRSEQRFYSFDDIRSFEASSNSDQILKHFDLSRLQDRLRLKLSDIKDFETSCWSAVSQVFSAPVGEVVLKENDNIHRELKKLTTAVSTTTTLNNVNPIGSAPSVLCRKILDDALTIRCWYLDLHRVESSRERLVFIDQMATRASELPRLPHCEYSASLDNLFDERVTRLRNISQGYFDHLTRFNKYRSILLSRSNNGNDEGVDFSTIQGVSSALQALGEVQVLSIAEEMLSVRLDVLRWADSSKLILSKSRISFDDLVEAKRSLDSILAGRSPTRTRILESIVTNDKVNQEIRSFAADDLTAFCGQLVSSLDSKYAVSQSWKERADSVVGAIKQHSGNQSSPQKPLPMVDLRRVQGLMSEYQDLAIFLPEDLNFLNAVYTEAITWSQELTEFVLDQGKTFSELLSRLQTSKLDRPRGILVDPARHVVDNLIELLLWHQHSAEATRIARSKQGAVENTAADLAAASNSKCVFSLVSEGSEILEDFGSKVDTIDFTVDPVVAVNLMAKELDCRRTMRVISRSKLESNFLGSSLLSRILSEDSKEGSPLQFLLLFLWQASAVDFIDKYDARKGTKDALTLESALDLANKRPGLSRTNESCADESKNWGVLRRTEEVTLVDLISVGKRNEKEAVRLLATSKELFRGPSRRIASIQDFAQSVKDLQNRFKLPFASNGRGLALSKTHEQQLDHLSKVLAWLVRTFPYPFLHQVSCDLTQEKRIAWDVLVGLNDRKPVGLENMGDCAGIALRVAELFDAASSWQAEISKVTMLSFRGAKRRGEETEGNVQPIVNVEQVRRLVRDPVLRKVAMPRESAVSEILESAKTFELYLHNFLGKDFARANNWQDRAPYPDNRSLVGRSGEFLLYRLTGSPLHSTLTATIEQISAIAQDVFADTPGKVSFEWIRQAVSWIDSLRSAVRRKSYTAAGGIERLVIVESDARTILEKGKSFFLDIPEDLKKTLSTHRIFMSTNKVEEKLKVIFKKGGAHHSVGGTAIKWCPILFDSLREDLARFDTWNARLDSLRSRLQNSDGTTGTCDSSALMRLTSCHEELVLLLEEGIESLVIAPSKDALEEISELHNEMRGQVQGLTSEHSPVQLDERIARRRFEDRGLLLKDRFKLLDALLSRSSLEFDQVDPYPFHKVSSSDGSFRDFHRTSIEAALQSAARMVGIQHQQTMASGDITFFSVKAEEIEHAIFARFQIGPNATMMSFDYKDKVRALGWILGDCINPNLCLQVLLGEIGAAELVSMPDKELVGDWKVLPDPHRGEDNNPGKEVAEKTPKGAKRESSVQDDRSVVEPGPGVKVTTKSSPGREEEEASLPTESDQSTQTAELSTDVITATKTGDRATEQPPAPPSLAASLVSSGNKRIFCSGAATVGKQSKRGKYLLNSSGQDVFLVAVSKPLIKFKARFSWGSDQRGALSGVLPESLSERGRLRVEEFIKFLSGKLKGGKWTAILLRMSVSSDEEAKKHRKFYKEYESMKRIAMFGINENTKLFLVTPKFQRVAAKVLGSSFGIETSTYAIALTRAS